MPYKYKLTEMSKTASPEEAEKELGIPQRKFEVGQVTYADNGLTKSEIYDIDDVTGTVSWKVTQLPGFDKLFDEVNEFVEVAKRVYQKTKDDKKFREIYDDARKVKNKIRTHLRNEYPEDYKRMAGRIDEEEVDEMSTSGGAGAYLTPYAFRKKGKKPNIKAYKEIGYKEVKEELQLVHVYDKDGKMYGTGSVEKVEGDKTVVRFDGNTVKRFPSDRVKPVKEEYIVTGKKGKGEAQYGEPYGTEKEARAAMEKILKSIKDIGEKPDAKFGVRKGPLEENDNPGATLGPGPKAGPDGVKDNYYVKGFKYKLVPKKIKNSGIITKKLF